MYPDDKDEVIQLYLDDIIPNRFQPREIFDERALKELAISIKEHGVIQPIIVRKSSNGKYEIIAGERRYKASALAGLTKIPAIIRDLDDKESSKVALLENLQRKNLNPIEEARTYQKILELDQMTQEELAKTMGKSQSSVANKIRLLALPEQVQDAILKEQISERHARALLNIPDSKDQIATLKKVMDTKMSVRALEEEIKSTYSKSEEVVEEKPIANESIDSTLSFINNNPLSPTAVIEDNTSSNYGKVTIAPPTDDNSMSGKYLNYGEIKSTEDNENDNKKETYEPNPLDFNPANISVDINEIKNNATDINELNNNSEDNGGSALDNLLNLGNMPQKKVEENNLAETAIKNSSENPKGSDYFTTDLSDISMEPESKNKFMEIIKDDTNNNNDMFSSRDVISLNIMAEDEQSSSDKYTVEEATEKIRALVNDLKEHGITINTDEMNFEKSYQIIIKINKTED